MDKMQEYKLDTTINEFGRLAWGFTLYCAGRRSYAPYICEKVLKGNANVILFPWRADIIALVMGKFASSFERRVAMDRAKRMAKEAGDPDWWDKGYKGGSLGADFDEDGWMQTVTYLAKHDDADPDLVNANWDGEDAPVTATFSDVDDFWFMVGSVIRHDIEQGDDAVFSAEELTDIVKAHAGDLDRKWVTNLTRDVTWGFYDPNEDATPLPGWEELHEFLVGFDVPDEM